MIGVGEKAPDFTLQNQDGEEVSLADFSGRKVLLVFYPLDFSPVCSDQLSIYQEVKPELTEKGVELLGISVDSAWAHKAWQEKLGIDTTLLADFEPKGEVSKAYGSYLEGGDAPPLVLSTRTASSTGRTSLPLPIPGPT